LEDIGGCDSNAQCTNIQGGFECSCKEGYFGDGKDCYKKDESNQAIGIGIGVGVSVGILALCFLALLILFFLRKNVIFFEKNKKQIIIIIIIIIIEAKENGTQKWR